MTNEVSYPSLTCILEYLEANKRIHITSRSPLLRKFDKTIPLRIENLDLSESYIEINRITYSIGQPGFDIQRFHLGKQPELNYLSVSIFPDFQKHTLRRIPEKMRIYEAMQILNNHFLGIFPQIFVESLKISEYVKGTLRLPDGLKLKIRNFDNGTDDFRDFLRLIDPSSFPLNTFCTGIPEDQVISDRILSTCEVLILRKANNYVPSIDTFAKVVHKNFTLESFDFSNHELEEIVRDWVQNWREIGFSCQIFCGWRRNHYLEAVRKAFNAKFVSLNSGLLPHQNHCLCIPLNLTSELIVHETKDGIKMIVIPSGSSILLDFSSQMTSPIEEEECFSPLCLFIFFGLFSFFFCILFFLLHILL